MKKLISLISTKGKSPQEVAKLVEEALRKYQAAKSNANKPDRNPKA